MSDFTFEIERFEPEVDSKFLWVFYKDPTFSEFFRRIPFNFRFEDIKDFENKTQSTLFSVYSSSGCVGFIVLSDIDTYGFSAHFGIMFAKQYWDKQYTNGVPAWLITKKFVDDIFKKTSINKLQCRFLANRKDLEESLLKGGFRVEGRFEDSVYFQGKFQDETQMAITHQKYKEFYRCHS